ncbi:MAG: MFS transporter [Bacteroidetes bacterium]|nr:MFS transporter [Bacteroidota bacterium]
MSKLASSSIYKSLILVVLIMAGEAIFLLPFAIPRIFRPTLLAVFDISNFELGMAFSAYGMVAMISYFFGGPLADAFSTRKLMTVAMIMTAIGGVFFAFVPAGAVLALIYGFWGLTTILLFWAALIRATREWGGPTNQGKAYGLLDGGRGLLAALVATVSVAIFASILPADVGAASLPEKREALVKVIWFFTGFVMVVGLLVWIVIPEKQPGLKEADRPKFSFRSVRGVVKMPAVWLQAVIILCAYVGYKGVDDFALYASEVHGYDDVQSARIGTLAFWIRPFAAMAAGFLGDRKTASWGIVLSFTFLLLGSSMLASGWIEAGMNAFLFLTIAGTCVGIYALRGIYFALFEEAKVPLAVTGTAVGLVSVIGYTPDIFMGPVMGYLLDRSPGEAGHQHVFILLAGFAFSGLLATLIFRRINQRKST